MASRVLFSSPFCSPKHQLLVFSMPLPLPHLIRMHPGILFVSRNIQKAEVACKPLVFSLSFPALNSLRKRSRSAGREPVRRDLLESQREDFPYSKKSVSPPGVGREVVLCAPSGSFQGRRLSLEKLLLLFPV